MVEATRGTVNGTILVAVGEGLLIGVGFLVAGVPTPVMFTIITIAFAMLPFGAWLAFTAAALVLVSGEGSGFAAAGVFLWGAIVMLAGDHFVWPTLVGGSARLPFLLAFVGIFGGIAAFGLFGLFLGPVIMAALLTVWREWIFRPVRRCFVLLLEELRKERFPYELRWQLTNQEVPLPSQHVMVQIVARGGTGEIALSQGSARVLFLSRSPALM